MRPMTRLVAVAGLVLATTIGGGVTASAEPTRVQAEGQVACGYDYGECVRQWFDYGFVKNYIVSEIYYRGGGYHFYWWN